MNQFKLNNVQVNFPANRGAETNRGGRGNQTFNQRGRGSNRNVCVVVVIIEDVSWWWIKL